MIHFIVEKIVPRTAETALAFVTGTFPAKIPPCCRSFLSVSLTSIPPPEKCLVRFFSVRFLYRPPGGLIVYAPSVFSYIFIDSDYTSFTLRESPKKNTSQILLFSVGY